MTQTPTRHSRNGWQQDEIDTLFAAVQNASESKKPLRDVFEDVGEQLSRKPNSIRNFYYMRVRDMPQLAPSQPAFRAFGEEELRELLRQVLMGRAQGESVRACVTRLAGGDRASMLRYQNKYRSILNHKPELLLRTAQELRAQGLPCPQNVLARRKSENALCGATELSRRMDDPRVKRLWDALDELLRHDEPACEQPDSSGVFHRKWLEAQREADRLRVEVDLLKLALEDAQTACAKE